MSWTLRLQTAPFTRIFDLQRLVTIAVTLGLAVLACNVESDHEAERSAVIDLSARWVATVANRDPAFIELVSSASAAHYEKLKHFALHAEASELEDLHPTDQLQALFFRLMLDPVELQSMSPHDVLVFAIAQGMIGSDLRRSDELRDVVVMEDIAQGRLYKFGRDDRSDRGLQYFEREDGAWRIDLRGELERLRNDFDAFVARSKISRGEAAFFILEARLFRKVTPEDFVPPLGGGSERVSPAGLRRREPQEKPEFRLVSIRQSLDDPAHDAVAIEDRRESLHRVLRLGDPLPSAPRFILTYIENDHATFQAGRELLMLRIDRDGPPLGQRLTDGPRFDKTRPVSMLEQAELGAGREGLMAQWRNVGLRGRPQLLQHAWFNPVHRPDGQMLGLRVRTIVEGSFWHQIGLEEGDLLTTFNGRPVDSTFAWRALLDRAETDLQIDIGIERAGRKMSFRTQTLGSAYGRQSAPNTATRTSKSPHREHPRGLVKTSRLGRDPKTSPTLPVRSALAVLRPPRSRIVDHA